MLSDHDFMVLKLRLQNDHLLKAFFVPLLGVGLVLEKFSFDIMQLLLGLRERFCFLLEAVSKQCTRNAKMATDGKLHSWAKFVVLLCGDFLRHVTTTPSYPQSQNRNDHQKPGGGGSRGGGGGLHGMAPHGTA